MITPQAVALHLAATLPRLRSDFFAEIIPTATAAGSVITCASQGHGLSVGQQIGVSSARYRNAVGSVTLLEGDVYRFELIDDHDFVAPRKRASGRTVGAEPDRAELAGFGSAWNGSREIVDIPNRRTIDLRGPSGVVPIVGSGQYVSEDRPAGVNGAQVIAAVPDADSFTIETPGVPAYPTGPVDGLRVQTHVRVAVAVDIERALEIYTQDGAGRPYLFVIPGDVDVSKERNARSDANSGQTPADEQRVTLLNNFSVVAMFDVSGEIAAEAVMEDCYGALYRDLLRVLHAVDLSDGSSVVRYLAQTAGHGQGHYNGAVYGHAYEWQAPAVVTFSQGQGFPVHAAGRDFDTTLAQGGDEAALLPVKANLDEEPLP
ncbi:MAG: hypothetical protein AAF360_02160 [Pseudomonadota bacterium]